MERKYVDSSNLKSVGYSPADETLEIEFNSGSVYQYFLVPKNLYDGLMNASSHGKYFDQYIKKANFRYREVG